MVQVLCSLCHGSLIEQLLARETQVYLKSLTTLLKTVQTTCLPTTWLPFWRFMPWFFTSKDWTGPSYPLNTTGGQVPAAPLVSCCGGLGLWHPSRSWNPSLVLSSVPRDSVPCPHQSGEGVLWGKPGNGWAERQCLHPSSQRWPLPYKGWRLRGLGEEAMSKGTLTLKAYTSFSFSTLLHCGFTLNTIQSLNRSC